MPLPKLSKSDILWVMTFCNMLSEATTLSTEKIEALLTAVIRAKTKWEQSFPNAGAEIYAEFYDRGNTTEDFIAFLGAEINKRRKL